MSIFSDVGHALTGTKTDAANKSDRENEDRRLERLRLKAEGVRAEAAETFGEGALNIGAGGGIVGGDGRAISDAEYDAVYGTGEAALFRTQAAAAPNAVPTGEQTLASAQAKIDEIDPAKTPASAPVPAYVSTGLTAQPSRRATGATTNGLGAVGGVDTAGVTSESISAGANLPPVGAPTTPAPTAPVIDEKGIRKQVAGLDTYQNALWELSQDNTGLSVAEAQLKKATEMANIQAGIDTQDSQRNALGIARGSRNRGDRALLERQAIGEAGFIGTDAARTASLKRAENEGRLGELRAQEVDADRRFKADAIKAAGDMGLNVAALEFQISDANVQSANNWINNEFAQANLGMQLDAQQTQNVMAYTQAMASLQFQYDAMSVQDQQYTDGLLMQKYSVDEGTQLALKQMKDAKKMNWNALLTQMAGGAAAGATAVLASDERVKTNVQEVSATAAEFEDFMSAMSANTYEYKEPEKFGDGLRFGLMAQDLEKTKLGKHMVRPVDGVKMVEIAPLALATASGLSLVHQRLKELEQSLKPSKQKAARS
jgi:hypothetical protein